MGVPTLIHLEPAQKQKLVRLARRRRTSLASEVRNAVRVYLQLPVESERELAQLTSEARRATETMIAKLDDTLVFLRSSRKRWGKK